MTLTCWVSSTIWFTLFRVQLSSLMILMTLLHCSIWIFPIHEIVINVEVILGVNFHEYLCINCFAQCDDPNRTKIWALPYIHAWKIYIAPLFTVFQNCSFRSILKMSNTNSFINWLCHFDKINWVLKPQNLKTGFGFRKQ